MSEIAPHEIIEEVVDAWMLKRRLVDRKDKKALWSELGEALGVSDRQVKRYYTGDTPLPIDKIIPLCNHVKSTTLIIYLMEAVDPPQIEDMDPFDFVEELLKNIDAFSAQARVAAQALNNTPSQKDLNHLKAAGRRLRDRLKRFEWLYQQILEEHHKTQGRKAREKRTQRVRKLQKDLESRGQMRMWEDENAQAKKEDHEKAQG